MPHCHTWRSAISSGRCVSIGDCNSGLGIYNSHRRTHWRGHPLPVGGVRPGKGIWTIPASRMKAGKEHVVPLSPRAAAIVKELGRVKAGPFVFPGGKEESSLSNMAMAALLKRMDRTDITVHGFRSSFRDWAGEQTSFARELIEFALAHQLKDRAEAAYACSSLPEKRRKLMEAWGTGVSGEGGQEEESEGEVGR